VANHILEVEVNHQLRDAMHGLAAEPLPMLSLSPRPIPHLERIWSASLSALFESPGPDTRQK